MGVYIKGMEMPKNCITCPLCECRNECAYCEVGDKYLSWDWDERLRNNRNDKCPLVEVPQHGDLIDRDELDDWFYATPIFTSDENADVWKVIRLDDIDNAPTIINAERRFYAL